MEERSQIKHANQDFLVEERSQIKLANQDEFSIGVFNQCSDYSSKDLELLLQELKIADHKSSIDEDEEFKDRETGSSEDLLTLNSMTTRKMTRMTKTTVSNPANRKSN